ncbi:MAG TPA: hypothetical protein ENJ95_22725 [Bacteroidetes bacterium]|nr:hypothetical protein [Bacteroidota bacterium]
MRRPFLIFSLFAFVATFLVRDNPFFWDTVQLASKHAHFFYGTNFSSLILPEIMDSGHIPAFGMYLAAVWKFFGKTLPAGHFAMLPFLLGIGCLLLKIGGHLSKEKKGANTGEWSNEMQPNYAKWLLLLCFTDPVLASQSVLVSPDVVLVFFFLLGVYVVLLKKTKWLLVLAVIGLGLVSMRGMMAAAGLFLYLLFEPESKFLSKFDKKKDAVSDAKLSGKTFWEGLKNRFSVSFFIKKLWPFLPGGLLVAAYLAYHWQAVGWIGYHGGSAWAPSFARVGLQGFIKNIAVLGWRMLDFGRVAEVLVLVYFGFVVLREKTFWGDENLKRLALLAACVFLATVPTQLFYKGLLSHRYLLPFFISLHLLLFHFLFGGAAGRKFRKPVFAIVILALLCGNLWVYPKKISQGWDGTLAHLHWFGLEKEAEKYLKSEGIPYNKVGTAFPNIGPREMIELNGAGEGFTEKDLEKNCYVLYSNIMNDFSDSEIDELEKDWQAVFQNEKMGVCTIVYKNPNPAKCGN